MGQLLSLPIFASDLSLSSQTRFEDHACLLSVVLVLSILNFKYGKSSIDIHYHNYYVLKLVHLEQNMSARSEIFTNKGVKTLKPFFSNQYIQHFQHSNKCVSGNIVTISNIEVSLLPSESALSKYAIKRTTIIFEKRLILAWWVTYILVTVVTKIQIAYYFTSNFLRI